MSRFDRFVAYSGAATIVYLIFFFGVLPLPGVSDEIQADVLPVIPWWCLVSFGSYLLWQVGWGIFNFNDVPEAYQGLMSDIKEAKDYLRQRGVDVD
ncbi:unnamed protein product [Jaminaea pallidilutea]